MEGERGKENAQKPRNEMEKMCRRRKGEAGETREEPRCSGLARRGLRLLLAALRQLGGVRRGIEIANAHYGYFPIEGRIPLSPLVRVLTTFLALSPSTSSPSPTRSLQAFSLLLSLFHSLHQFIFSLAPSLCLFSSITSHFPISYSYRIFSYPLILPHDFFSFSCSLFSEILSSFSLFLSRKTETHAEKHRQSLSFPHVPFLPVSVTFSLRTWIVYPSCSIVFSPREKLSFRSPFFLRFLALFFLCLTLFLSFHFLYIWPILFFSYPCKYTFVFSLRASCYEHYHLEAASDSRTVNLGYFTIFTLSASPLFILITPFLPCLLFWHAFMIVKFYVI